MKARIVDFTIGCLPFLTPFILTAVFVGLKLVDVIGWGWGVVISPLWIAGIIVLLLAVIGGSTIKRLTGWGYEREKPLTFVPFGSYPINFHGRANAFKDAMALQRRGKRVRMRNTDQAFIVEVEDETH